LHSETCPKCGADLRDGAIPEKILKEYAVARDEEWDGQPQYYSRVIMVEIRGVCDGGLFYMCPDCDGKWHRWPEGSYLRARAEPYVSGTWPK